MTDNAVTPPEQETKFSNGNHDKPHEENQETSTNSEEKSQEQYETLTIRALVSSKEAGVIIGKGGKKVSEIRDSTGAKAGVSKVIQGVPTRVLSIIGTLEAVSEAYGKVARALIENIDSSPEASTTQKAGTNTAAVRILVAHNIMGSIIGKGGSKIKAIQETSGSRMIATKEMLGQSTERVVEIVGSPESIVSAIFEVGKCILFDLDKTQNTILYNPLNRPPPLIASNGYYNTFQSGFQPHINGEFNYMRGMPRFNREGHRFDNHVPHPHVQPHINPAIQNLPHTSFGPIGIGSPISGVPFITKRLTIASDMVGCVIGKNGTKIAEIRRLSNAKISIAKENESDNNTRLFTIYGSAEANETAIYLIYAQLEAEKERRASHPVQAYKRDVPVEK